jgi:hypothetical protein
LDLFLFHMCMCAR